MAEIDDLEIVDASNTARFPENQAPSTVNDGARALEGIIARWNKDLDGSVLTTGTATAYVYAANQTLTAYADGLTLGVDFHVACGASPTINVDALGAQSLVYPDGTALAAGDISTGQKGIIKYDGTNFQFVSVSSPQVSRSSVQDQDFVYAADTGAANAYVITLSPAVTAYAAGQRFSFKATNANTAASTLNVNALGVKNIYRHDSLSALTGGEIVVNGIYEVTYDGTQFLLHNPATNVDVQTFTASGTWTKPAGATRILVQARGGGGSGGSGTAGQGGNGGGGGAYNEHWFDASATGATETITIGGGGAAVGSGVNGNAGGDTTFGSLFTVYGGAGGGNTSGVGGGGGGMMSAGSSNTGGEPSVTGAASNSMGGGNGGATNVAGGFAAWGGGGGGGGGNQGNVGGDSYKGGAGGGSGRSDAVGNSLAGGTSVFGGNGGAGSFDSGTATAGTAPGGGGGGTETGTSGAGADGDMIVTTWISG